MINRSKNENTETFYTPEGTSRRIMVLRMSSVRPSVRPLAISCATNSSFTIQRNFFKLAGMIDTDV